MESPCASAGGSEQTRTEWWSRLLDFRTTPPTPPSGTMPVRHPAAVRRGSLRGHRLTRGSESRQLGQRRPARRMWRPLPRAPIGRGAL